MIQKKKILSITVILLCLVIGSCTPPKNYYIRKGKTKGVDNLIIKVLLEKTNRISISSNSKFRVTYLKSHNVKYNGSAKEIIFSSENIDSPLLIESFDTPVCVNKKQYRGIIELHNVLGKIYVVNVLSVAEYLYGVVPSEIPASWEMEALKAQAVAARTYTYHYLTQEKKEGLYDIGATTSFQVYGGLDAEKDETSKAVSETSGDIITYNNIPIVAFFHSTCGGKTSDDKTVWNGEDMAYLTSVKCPYCSESPNFTWEDKLSLYEVKRFLLKKYSGVGNITGISLQKDDARVTAVFIKHKNGILKISGNDFRLLFPPKRIKSLYFSAIKEKNGLILKGYGWGHGVGLCQWGAKGMAQSGKSYEIILKYYYKGIKLLHTNQLNYASR